MIVKQRAKASEIERMDLVGSVEGSDCILGELIGRQPYKEPVFLNLKQRS